MSYGHDIGLSNLGLRTKWSGISVMVTKSEILGCFAAWAVRQSPYVCPDGLADAIRDLDAYLKNEMECLTGDFYCNSMSLDQLQDMISERIFMLIPEIEKWNHRKNGNESQLGWSDRYHQTPADDDFIDLCALATNVTFGVFREALLDTDPGDRLKCQARDRKLLESDEPIEEHFEHAECLDCDALIYIHWEGGTHCDCGDGWPCPSAPAVEDRGRNR